MALGEKNLVFLLITLDGVFCGLFHSKCSTATCQCGETASITCTLTHQLENFSLKHCDEPLPGSSLPTEGRFTCNNKILIEWTKDELKVDISNVKFSDNLKYYFTLIAKGLAGYDPQLLNINVMGTCKPEISKNNKTEELECEAESINNASIVWIDKHRKVYPASRTQKPEQLNTGYKIQSFLKVTEEIGDNQICCYVSNPINGVYKENESCLPDISAINAPSSTSSSLNHTPTVISILVILLAVAAFFGVYHLKRRRNFINNVFRHSQSPIIKNEVHEGTNKLQPYV